MIAARHRCFGANHNFDGTGLGDSQQAEPQPLAKACGPAYCSSRLLRPRLSQQARPRRDADEVATADFSLHMKAEDFQEPLDRRIEASFHCGVMEKKTGCA